MKIKSLILILVLVVVLSSCSGEKIDYDYHSGFYGLELSFVDNTPPKEVQENSVIPLNLKLANLGASDVDLRYTYFALRGDDFYISSQPKDYNDEEEYNSIYRIIDDNMYDESKSILKVMHGKSYFYPEGELAWLYPYLEAKNIIGSREQPSTKIYAEICYPYSTLFTKEVCVDVNPYDEDKRTQICEAQEQTFTGGQGGPLAVTRINNIPQFVRRSEPGGRGIVSLVQPSFEIEISNKGSGIIVSDGFKDLEDENNIINTCQLKSETISLQDINRFKIEAFLNNVKLDCTPKKPYIKGAKVIVKCTVPIEDVVFTTTNYQDTLAINLSYVYKDTVSAQFDIVRSQITNYDNEDLTYMEQDLNPAYVNGEDRCSFCNFNPTSSECSAWPSKTKTLIKNFKTDSAKVSNPDLQLSFSCACSQTTCYEYNSDGACVIGSTWCSGSNYCCDPNYEQKKKDLQRALENLENKNK